MPPPPNQTITTAIDLGSTLPISYVQQQDDGGVTYPCWWSFTVPAGLNEISARAYGDFSTWIPAVTVWRGPTGAPSLANGGSGRDVWNQVLCDPGETLYIRSQKAGPDIAPAITTVEVVAGPVGMAEPGDIVHPDSSTPYPAVVVDVNSAEPKAYIGSPAAPFSLVNTSGILRATGRVAVYDFTDDIIKIYDPPYTAVLTTVAGLPFNSSGYVIGTNGVTGWVAVRRGIGSTSSKAYLIDTSGTVIAGPYDLGINSRAMDAVTISPDEDTIYFVRTSQTGQPGFAIWQFTVSTLTVSTFLANGNTGVGPYWWAILQMLANGTLIIGKFTLDGTPNNFLTSNTIQRYDAAATLLEEWSIGSANGPAWFFTAADDPLSFWVWTVHGTDGSTPDGLNKYWNFVVGNPSVPTPTVLSQFIEGVSQEPASLSAEPFGTDWGGAPWIAGGSTPTLRLTQLPVEVAYDYAALRPYVKGDGLNWITPPRG